MDTLLTESMISGFSSLGLLRSGFYREASSEAFFWKLLLELRGNFRQNGTQLVLLEYHAALPVLLFCQTRVGHGYGGVTEQMIFELKA